MQKRVPGPVGVRLRETRGLVGLGARELDRLAKTAEGHTSLIESGVVTNLKLQTVEKLAGVLGVTMGWLIDGAGRAPTAKSVRDAVSVARDRRADDSGPHRAVAASEAKAG